MSNPFLEYETIKEVSFNVEGERKTAGLILRLDPLFGRYSLHSTCITEGRSKMVGKIKHTKKPREKLKKKNCIFCEPKIYEVTPEPRIDHSKDGLFTPEGKPVISVPNLFPFSPDHYVTVFADHKVKLPDWTKRDLVNYIETAFYFANKFKNEKAEGMWDIINFGSVASATQPHPHAQRGTLEKDLSSLITLEKEALIRREKELDYDPFWGYMWKVRNSSYFIFENDFLFICAPFAPRFPDQVDIISQKGFNNLLDTNKDYRGCLAESMIKIIHSLSEDRGVSDFNLTLHQDFFDVKGDYRLHWHFYPRNKNRIAGMELNNVHILCVPPEVTAKALRKRFGVSGYD